MHDRPRPKVRKGQHWLDLDKRRNGRIVEIVDVIGGPEGVPASVAVVNVAHGHRRHMSVVSGATLFRGYELLAEPGEPLEERRAASTVYEGPAQ